MTPNEARKINTTRAILKHEAEYRERGPLDVDIRVDAITTAVSRASVNPRSRIDTVEHVLIKAIAADHWHARPRKEWERIANALDHDYLAHHDPRRLDRAWRRLVSLGYVNSYVKRGERLYEMNLGDLYTGDDNDC